MFDSQISGGCECSINQAALEPFFLSGCYAVRIARWKTKQMTKQYNVETGMQVGNLPSGILGFLDDWYGAEFLPPRPAAIKLAARAPLQIVF